MRIKCLQHVEFEGPAKIGRWIVRNNHHFEIYKTYENEFPDLAQTDALLLMGGPMSVNDEDALPWLRKEKEIIKSAINSGKKVMGVCLGAQLIANALGAKVYNNVLKEIGWFPVQFTEKRYKIDSVNSLPDELTVFHWHGETFDLPENAIHFAQSPACMNQAYAIDDNVLAFQFHFELTEDGIKQLIQNCGHELVDEKFIQNEEDLISLYKLYSRRNEEALESILKNFFKE